MKKLSLFIAIVLIVPNTVHSQPRQDRAGIVVEQQIAIANYLLLDSTDDQAAEWLARAKEFKARADQALIQKNQSSARSLYDQTEIYVEKSINRLLDLRMQDLKNDLDAMQKSMDAKQLELLEKAKNHLEKARTFRQQQRFRKTIEHLRICQFQIERVQRLAALSEPGNYVQVEADRYDELKNSTLVLLSDCPDPEAKKLLRQANSIEAKVPAALTEGQDKLALNYYFQASRLLLRAMDLCRGYPASDFENAFEQVELVGEMLSLYENRLGKRGQAEIQALAEANQLYEQARFALSNQDYKSAELKSAQILELLSSSRESSQPGNRARRIEQELYRLNRQIDQAQSNRKYNSYKSHVDAAAFCAEQARLALDERHWGLGLASIVAGKSFLQIENTTVVRPGQLKIRLETIGRLMQSQRRQAVRSENKQFLLAYYEKAQQAFEQKEYKVAQIYLDTIRNATMNRKRR